MKFFLMCLILGFWLNLNATQLMDAMKHGNLKIFKLLIDNGADVNEKPAFGEKPLDYAVGAGNVKMVKILISKGAYGNYAVCNAAFNNDYKMVKLLIENGYSVHDSFAGDEPIEVAARKNNIKIVKFLIKNGAITEHSYSVSYLKNAIRGGYNMVKLMLDNGVNTNHIADKKKVLDYAIKRNNTSIIKLLMSRLKDTK